MNDTREAELKRFSVTGGSWPGGCLAALQEALASLATARQERDALSQQLEADRTAVADCVTAANKAIDSRHWLTEGRGSYEWNDDKWHEEFYAAALEIKAAIAPMTKIAANWTGCPQTSAEVAKARIDLRQERDAALEQVQQLRRELDAARGEGTEERQ